METSPQRVVLITGVSSGIGLACATHLASRGFRVYGTSRQPIAGGVLPDNVTNLLTDVTTDQSVRDTIATILATEGRLDIVINNAGMAIAGPVESTPVEDAKQQFEVNFFGVLRVCRAALPAMRAQGSGYIVNIGSIGGVLAIPYQSMYSASKFALEGLSEALRLEVKPFGIRVVLIEPGDHKTSLTQNRKVLQPNGITEPYRLPFHAALQKMAEDEQNGPAPDKVAHLLEKVVNRSNPRLRYTVGSLPQRAAVWLKRLTPNALTEHIMGNYYGLGK